MIWPIWYKLYRITLTFPLPSLLRGLIRFFRFLILFLGSFECFCVCASLSTLMQYGPKISIFISVSLVIVVLFVTLGVDGGGPGIDRPLKIESLFMALNITCISYITYAA